MSSFFVPPNLTPTDNSTRFSISSNTILQKDQLFVTWYQYVLFSVGLGFIAAGLIVLLLQLTFDRQDAEKPNVFSAFGFQVSDRARRFWSWFSLRRREDDEEDEDDLAQKRLSTIATFRMMAHTGAPPASTPDSSLCILPINGPSPQRYWDASYTPSIRGAKTPRTGAQTPRTGAHTPRTGAQTPKTGAHTPKTGAQTPRSGAQSPRTGFTTPKLPWTSSSPTLGGSSPAIKASSPGSPITSDDEDFVGPLQSRRGPSRIKSAYRHSFAPLNFTSNEAHVARPISAATSLHGDSGDYKRPPASALFFGYQSYASKDGVPSPPIVPAEIAELLGDTCLEQGFDGLVLLFDDSHKASIVNDLLERLQHNGIPVIVMVDSDAALMDGLHFGIIDGLIIQNAHVLRDGQRRDYFRAARLRDQIARVKRQQSTRSGFFFGFLELWTTPPSAATLRRAYKLADFFGAVIEARPASSKLPDRTKKEMPLSGFDFLKKTDVVWSQKQWSQNLIVDSASTGDSDTVKLDSAKINDIIPHADRLLAPKALPLDQWAEGELQTRQVPALDYAHTAPRLSDFWNTSSCGAQLCPVGCFNLREEVVQDHYDEILRGQKHLKDLNMLHQMSIVELSGTLEVLSKVVQETAHPVLLAELREGLKLGKVRVHKGLDSGFNLPDSGAHFLGLSDSIVIGGQTIVDIYVSQKNADDAATIWHVWLAHNGIPRSIRYLEELHLTKYAKVVEDTTLPKSIRKELDESTESELLYLLQQMKLAALRHPLAEPIRSHCFRLLVEQTSKSSWHEKHSKACLDASVKLRDLFQMRLDFHKDKGAIALPDVDDLVELFRLMEAKFGDCLFQCDRATLNRLLGVMLQVYSTSAGQRPVDIATDLYSLIFFCVVRKYAFEDVYLETTDRCPLFLTQQDQAGVFAELWVLGSQCEIYFGILPRALGEIIHTRYRKYLDTNPPPLSAFNGKDVFTAYSNVTPKQKFEGGIDPNARSSGAKELPGDVPGHKLSQPDKDDKQDDTMQKLGALSIFCFPAMMDVLLLTFLGRGFYLTAFMDDLYHVSVKTYANYAILTSLLMTGGITGWIGSTGGFYLYNYAFDNMTHFFIQRFSGSLMLTGAVGLCGFIGFGAQDGWFAGFVFVLYLFALSTFLNVLGVMTTLHRANAPLSSGRIAIWKCIPILFISPIITTFVNNHDLLIYMLIVYTFLAALLLSLRNLCHEWTTWQAKVPTVKEKDLVKWFKEKVADPDDEDDDQDDQLLAEEARDLLKAEVKRYHNRSLYMKIFYQVSDQFVKKMAVGHPYALWLLKKEAGGNELPETYTATWFVQLELALGNQRLLTRGLKEHSQFITFRYSKYDIGQNVGLFLAALMDRWVAIVMSARTPAVGLYSLDPNADTDVVYATEIRYTLCFGLLYFLFGAVFVDVVLARYWPELSKLSDVKLSDLHDLDRVRADEAAVRRKHYRNGVLELLTFLVMILGATTLLLWAFVADWHAIVLFYCYVSAYTGVLFFQFNRCFTKHRRAHVITVLACCAVGFIVGVFLRSLNTTASFYWTTAIALNIACVPSAIGTFILVGYFSKPAQHQDESLNKRGSSYDQRVLDLKSAPPSRAGSSHSHSIYSTSDCDSTHVAIGELLKNLTLDIDVNVRWSLLPEDVRRFVVARVMGDQVQLTWNVRTWLVDEGKNVMRFNHGVGGAIAGLRSSVADLKGRSSTLSPSSSSNTLQIEGPELSAALPRSLRQDSFVTKLLVFLIGSIADVTKWVAIISGAASDTPKELWYALRANPFRGIVLWTLLKVWKVCWWVKNVLIYVFLIAGKKPYGQFLSLLRHGAPRTLEAHRILVETPLSTKSGFIYRTNISNLVIDVYDGDLNSAPDNKKPVARAFYGSSHRLHGRENANGAVATYHYDNKSASRWPVAKTTAENGMEYKSLYDKYGRIKSGRIFRGQNEFSFEYVFSKRPKGNSEVLQANYSSVYTDSPLTMSVFWSIQPRAGSDMVTNWTPSEKIQRVVLTVDGETFDVRWIYKHARDPELETTVISKAGTQTVPGAPEQITRDDFGFLKKPKDVHFEDEDLLIHHPINWIERLCRTAQGAGSVNSRSTNRLIKQMPTSWSSSDKKIVYRKMPTAQLRTMLWKSWAKPPYLDAVTACYLDEMILRKEPLLKKYWRLRDAGHLLKAAHLLDENLEQIVSAIEPTVEATETCPLHIKTSDLFEMGLAKDSTRLTARPEDTYRDTATSTSVIFSDNGCWPDNPGGVSNCRRDLVNGHTTIRGHCLAEGANDYGIPRYQIERNVNSLKVLPLWGLDGKTPYHGLLDNLLQTQVDDRIYATKIEQDVKDIFIPLLKSFVRGARSRRYTREDLVTYSNVILKMNRYFETRDFNKTWQCEAVWQAWIEAWLVEYDDPNVNNVRDMMAIETPNMNDFRDALNLYICYFFIYSVDIPADCPKVFQTTHHGISSLYGILLKYRRGTTWGIWDHAILWREMCLNISPAQCLLPVPVQSMLLAGVKLACHLAYTHADIILPCTSVFNPDWEQDLGTDQGLRGSKKLFARKIDPIVNGIGNMDAFQPVKETRTKFPTTVMLSNVQFIKDVKNAVLAADVIINKFGFKDYRLTVYGAQDRQPSYALETTTLINTRGMSGKVTLAGFGSPKEVLKDAWLFMNSSLSEGLPLAIGEAALSGIPIVATEVGATALVLTDPDDSSKRYGEVVPPNDPEALARAQLSILAMLGPWAQYTSDAHPPPPLPDTFTEEDVEWITKRMYEKTADRKALGLKLRDVVLRSFHGKRYLREHEQMYWIQRKQAEIRRAGRIGKMHPPVNATFGEQNLYSYDVNAENEQSVRPRWQDFQVSKLQPRRRSKNHDKKGYESVEMVEKA